MIPSHLFHPHHLCLHLWLVRKSKTFQQCFQQLTDSVQKPISTSNSSNTDLDVKQFKNESQRQTVFFKISLNVKQFKTISQRQTVQNPISTSNSSKPISTSSSSKSHLNVKQFKTHLNVKQFKTPSHVQIVVKKIWPGHGVGGFACASCPLPWWDPTSRMSCRPQPASC